MQIKLKHIIDIKGRTGLVISDLIDNHMVVEYQDCRRIIPIQDVLSFI